MNTAGYILIPSNFIYMNMLWHTVKRIINLSLPVLFAQTNIKIYFGVIWILKIFRNFNGYLRNKIILFILAVFRFLPYDGPRSSQIKPCIWIKWSLPVLYNIIKLYCVTRLYISDTGVKKATVSFDWLPRAGPCFPCMGKNGPWHIRELSCQWRHIRWGTCICTRGFAC